jgi:hypothetical protein
MSSANIGEQVVDRLSDSSVGLIDPSNKLRNNFQPSIDTDRGKSFGDCCIDFRTASMGKPEGQKTQGILQRAARLREGIDLKNPRTAGTTWSINLGGRTAGSRSGRDG